MILLNPSSLATAILLIASQASAHGSHNQQTPVIDHMGDWATKHMAEEHHIQGFDAPTLFTLHDFTSSGHWSRDDIKRMYGLLDASTAHVDESHKESAADKVLALFDMNKDDRISSDEFVEAWKRGFRLPDLGFGPGRHGDDEYEYEIHHWEKYHGDDTKEEDLTHPEDIAHFKKHEEEDAQQKAWEKMSLPGVIIEHNIPQKFLIKD